MNPVAVNEDHGATVRTIETLFRRGTLVYVLGLVRSNEYDLMDELDRMAMAGGTARGSAAGRRFFHAQSATALRRLLPEITEEMGSCTYALPWPVGPDETLDVRLNGRPLRSGVDFLNGPSPQSPIALIGDTCAEAMRAGAAVQVQYPCVP